MEGLLSKLRQRKLVQWALAYAAGAWVLLQALGLVSDSYGWPHLVMRLALGVVVLGFLVTLLLAWYHGEQGRQRVSGTELVIIALVLAVGGGLLWQFTRIPQAEIKSVPTAVSTSPLKGSGTVSKVASETVFADSKSIAVLPFENLSADKSNKYFADGMQDLILSKLAEIGGLTVISRTSTMRYQSHPEDLKAIGHQLGVANLLEGSVQKAGDQVLINVQLINAQTDHHIWAQSYQRTLQNIFGVEGEVAEKVAAALKARLDPAEQARVAAVPTRNPAAYDAYLRGLVAEGNATGLDIATLEAAVTAYGQAVKLDPSFALAWAHLSSVDSIIYFNYFDPARRAEARAALGRALALAPDAVATQLASGDYNYHGLRHYAPALVAYRKVLTVAPNNAGALANIGYVERRLGDWQTAIDYLQRALALDPRNISVLSNLGLSYWSLRDDREAKEHFWRGLAISPGNPGVLAQLAGIYQSEGALAQAASVLAGATISPNDWLYNYPIVVRQALLTRRYGDAIQVLHTALATKGLAQEAVGSYEQLLGFSETLAGHADAARAAYTRAVAVLTAVLHRKPDSPIAYSTLAFAQAGLGEKTAALASARHAIAMLPVGRDAFVGPFLEVNLAEVQARLGEKAQASATLQRLLALPPGSWASIYLTPALLRLDPAWGPIRKDPAFQALLKKYAEDQPASVPPETANSGTTP